MAVLVMVRSGGPVWVTATTTVPELLLVLVSPPPVTDAVLVINAAAFAAIETLTTIGAARPTAIGLGWSHVSVVAVEVEQSQPDPEGTPRIVSPLGIVSLTVAVPVVAAVPELATASTYAAVPPCTNVDEVVLVNVRSGLPAGETVTVTVPELLPVFVSPPPLTDAVFVMLAGALGETFTSKVMGGALAPAPIAPARAQLADVNVEAAQSQPAPAGVPITESPAGIGSVTLIGPTVAPVPTLVTNSV